MQAADALFAPDNRYGVHAWGIGSHSRDGRNLGYRGLVVRVARKSFEPVDPVPVLRVRLDGRERTVVPDIQAGGAPLRAASTSRPVGSGLHLGAAVLGDQQTWGGVGALLGKSHPTHLLTAGHLFEQGGVGALFAFGRNEQPVRVGTLVSNLLDTADPMDAALVALDATGLALWEWTEQFSGRPAATHWWSPPSHDVFSGQIWRPTSGSWSPATGVWTTPWTANLSGGARPSAYTIRKAWSTQPGLTVQGDSGAATVWRDATSAYVAALVAGGDSGFDIVQPFAPVRQRLRQQFPDLDLWSP